LTEFEAAQTELQQDHITDPTKAVFLWRLSYVNVLVSKWNKF